MKPTKNGIRLVSQYREQSLLDCRIQNAGLILAVDENRDQILDDQLLVVQFELELMWNSFSYLVENVRKSDGAPERASSGILVL